MTGDPVRNRRRLAAERARRARQVVQLADYVPADGEAHHVHAGISEEGTHEPVYVDGAGPLPPQVVPQAGEKLTLDTRKVVVVSLHEVKAGRLAGWRASCNTCPGMAAGNRKAEAREKAMAHVEEHRTAGHRVQLVEPLGRTKAKR